MREGYLVELFSKHDCVIGPGALQLLCSMPEGEAKAASEAALDSMGNKFLLTLGDLEPVLERLAADKKANLPAVRSEGGFEARAKSLQANIKFHLDRDVSENSTCTGTIGDFISYFNDRFRVLKGLLRARQTRLPFYTVAKTKSSQSREKCRVIGMVADSRTTKNGHLLVEFEDDSGSMPCLFSKRDEQMLEIGGRLLLDEVVAFDGFSTNGLFIVNEVTWPELPIRERRTVDSDACIALLSDLHVGSKFFMREEFERFLEFLNGKGPEKELAGRIKYLLIAGDLVDGVGVYPSQEEELVTKDIYEQYEQFNELMSAVPDWIEVVIAPGNHDPVRIAEPQPRLPREFTGELEKKKNFHFVGNPAFFDIEGLSVLMYHGFSMDTLVSSLSTLRSGYQNPELVGIEMLKRRHLCPIYGRKPIVPEKKDYLVVDAVPDLFHFGHVHKNGYANYRGTTIINSGTWQNTTDFQLKMGHVPSPCQLPIYELRSASYKVLNFK